MDFTKKFGAIEAEGTWFEYDDARIKFMGLQSRKAQARAFDAFTADEALEMAKNNGKYNYEGKTANDLNRVAAKLASRYLIDWSNITENGVDVPFTPEKAFEFCFYHPEFLTWVNAKITELGETVEQAKATKTAVSKKK